MAACSPQAGEMDVKLGVSEIGRTTKKQVLRMRFLHACGFRVGQRTGDRETRFQKSVHEHSTRAPCYLIFFRDF